VTSKIVLVMPLFEADEATRAMVPPGFELVATGAGSPEYKAAIGQAEYLVGFVDMLIKEDLYKAAPRLKLIEHALMLMLAVSRQLIRQHANVSGGRWRGNKAPPIHELRSRTLGIIGLGTIGKKTARLAQAFGMTVNYYDIARLTEAEEDALGVRFRLMRELLRTSDIVSLHVPLNDTTRNLIGAAELALMKPEAILVNTSRGPVVNEAALHEALVANKLFGAGLDVFAEEPPPSNHPFFSLDNVVLTAHLAGPTQESSVSRLRNGFDNVERVARGEKPLWVIPEMGG